MRLRLNALFSNLAYGSNLHNDQNYELMVALFKVPLTAYSGEGDHGAAGWQAGQHPRRHMPETMCSSLQASPVHQSTARHASCRISLLSSFTLIWWLALDA